MPLGEDSVFNIGDVSFGARFLSGVGVTVSVSSLAPAVSGPSLLLYLVFVPQGDVLVMTTVCNNFDTTAVL